MTNYHVACSPITKRIFAGRVDKSGKAWTQKSDVTGAACGAVIEHVLANKEPVEVSVNGVPTYRISVEEIKAMSQHKCTCTFPCGGTECGPTAPVAKPRLTIPSEAFDDLAYQILALALNNGTREAFPGKLKKLLEEIANGNS